MDDIGSANINSIGHDYLIVSVDGEGMPLINRAWERSVCNNSKENIDSLKEKSFVRNKLFTFNNLVFGVSDKSDKVLLSSDIKKRICSFHEKLNYFISHADDLEDNKYHAKDMILKVCSLQKRYDVACEHKKIVDDKEYSITKYIRSLIAGWRVGIRKSSLDFFVKDTKKQCDYVSGLEAFYTENNMRAKKSFKSLKSKVEAENKNLEEMCVDIRLKIKAIEDNINDIIVSINIHNNQECNNSTCNLAGDLKAESFKKEKNERILKYLLLSIDNNNAAFSDAKKYARKLACPKFMKLCDKIFSC